MMQREATRAKPVRYASHLGRNLALAVFSVILFFTIAELVARVIVSPPSGAADAPTHAEHETLIVALGSPALNETM